MWFNRLTETDLILPDIVTKKSILQLWMNQLSNMEGEAWKGVRSAFSPIFTSGKLRYENEKPFLTQLLYLQTCLHQLIFMSPPPPPAWHMNFGKFWIRIRMDSHWFWLASSGSCGSGSKRAKLTHNIKKLNFFVFKCWMFSFEAWMLLFMLGHWTHSYCTSWRPREFFRKRIFFKCQI